MMVFSLSGIYAGTVLNDTGISYSGAYPQGIIEACRPSDTLHVPALPQQDCAVGSRKPGSPFEFTKIDRLGVKLSDNANVWSCVLDNRTGLMWEVKTPPSTPKRMHSQNERFTWYNSDPTENDGAIGSWNKTGDHCADYQPDVPRSYCHIEQFVSRVNRKGLCGYRDWRVPRREELGSIIHYGQFQPAIATAYFPHALNTFYWTLEPAAGRQLEAWAINFEFGNMSGIRKTDPRPVRLVRDHHD